MATEPITHSAEPFYAAALEHYFTSFDFMGDPLDIALRKFLMTASLPTETQQIDRVVETFAKRYSECNPGLYSSNDTPYVLAFSLIMLSTDQFNPSNKSKMSKADYVRNTRLDDVAPEILEVRIPAPLCSRWPATDPSALISISTTKSPSRRSSMLKTTANLVCVQITTQAARSLERAPIRPKIAQSLTRIISSHRSVA